MSNEKIHTNKADLWQDKEGICHLNYEPTAYLEEKDIAEQLHLLAENIGTTTPDLVMVNGRYTRGMSATARHLLRTQSYKAMAVVVDSSLSRLVFDFLRANQPPHFPVKLFRDEEQATEWLLRFKE